MIFHRHTYSAKSYKHKGAIIRRTSEVTNCFMQNRFAYFAYRYLMSYQHAYVYISYIYKCRHHNLLIKLFQRSSMFYYTNFAYARKLNMHTHTNSLDIQQYVISLRCVAEQGTDVILCTRIQFSYRICTLHRKLNSIGQRSHCMLLNYKYRIPSNMLWPFTSRLLRTMAVVEAIRRRRPRAVCLCAYCCVYSGSGSGI